MKLKRSIVLVVMMVFISSVSMASSVQLSDIKGHWAEPYIQTLVDKGIISGYSDGTFNPNGLITRAEVATIVAKSNEVLETKIISLESRIVALEAYSKPTATPVPTQTYLYNSRVPVVDEYTYNRYAISGSTIFFYYTYMNVNEYIDKLESLGYVYYTTIYSDDGTPMMDYYNQNINYNVWLTHFGTEIVIDGNVIN